MDSLEIILSSFTMSLRSQWPQRRRSGGSCSLGKSCRTATSGAGWWLTYPSEKDESQFGWLFQLNGKIKNVPNHQPGCVRCSNTKCHKMRRRWGTMVTCDPIIRSLVTLLSPVTATLLSGHLRPYPFNNSHPPCVPPYNCLHSTSLFKLPPPAFHYTIVSILLLYLNFPPPAFH